MAKTIGAGLVDETTTTQAVVGAALIGAITWNLITWRLGIPSSSSHALIGGLLGATVIAAGTEALNPQGIVNKVLVPLVSSPIIGFLGAFVLMLSLFWIFRNAMRRPLARRARADRRGRLNRHSVATPAMIRCDTHEVNHAANRVRAARGGQRRRRLRARPSASRSSLLRG